MSERRRARRGERMNTIDASSSSSSFTSSPPSAALVASPLPSSSSSFSPSSSLQLSISNRISSFIIFIIFVIVVRYLLFISDSFIRSCCYARRSTSPSASSIASSQPAASSSTSIMIKKGLEMIVPRRINATLSSHHRRSLLPSSSSFLSSSAPPHRCLTSSTRLCTRSSSSLSSSPSSSLSSSSSCPAAPSFVSTLCEFRLNTQRLKDGEPFTRAITARSEMKDEEVFANADLPLSRIHAVGFDFDYTLANYNDNVSSVIFRHAQEFLVKAMGYPQSILSHSYDHSFPIRGLHFDSRTGFILKIDQFGKVSTGTVFHGRENVPLATIVEAYRGVSITRDYRLQHLHQMADLFALAETNLLADIIQTFKDESLEHSSEYVYRDVRRAIEHVHVSGVLHDGIRSDPGRFLEPNPKLGEYLIKLRDAGKLTFLLTNSPWNFIDSVMTFMMSSIATTAGAAEYNIKSPSDWRELFDVVICSAGKPAWFDRRDEFRRVNTATGNGLSWQSVTQFRRGEVYTAGSLTEFMRMVRLQRPTLSGHQILFMGDHVSVDLTAPWQTARWRTVAIVRELAHEIRVQSSDDFKSHLAQLLRIEALISYGQRLFEDGETIATLDKLKKERAIIKRHLLVIFNSSFGSVFRTSSHRTEFFFSVGRYADVYTSSVTNFLHYNLDHCFYTDRQFFPHEEHHHNSLPAPPTPATIDMSSPSPSLSVDAASSSALSPPVIVVPLDH